MKNLIRKISLIMCVIMLTFAVSACGKSDNDSKKNEPKTEDTAKDDAKDDAKDYLRRIRNMKKKIMTMLMLKESLKHWKIS